MNRKEKKRGKSFAAATREKGNAASGRILSRICSQEREEVISLILNQGKRGKGGRGGDHTPAEREGP